MIPVPPTCTRTGILTIIIVLEESLLNVLWYYKSSVQFSCTGEVCVAKASYTKCYCDLVCLDACVYTVHRKVYSSMHSHTLCAGGVLAIRDVDLLFPYILTASSHNIH